MQDNLNLYNLQVIKACFIMTQPYRVLSLPAYSLKCDLLIFWYLMDTATYLLNLCELLFPQCLLVL